MLYFWKRPAAHFGAELYSDNGAPTHMPHSKESEYRNTQASFTKRGLDIVIVVLDLVSVGLDLVKVGLDLAKP